MCVLHVIISSGSCLHNSFLLIISPNTRLENEGPQQKKTNWCVSTPCNPPRLPACSIPWCSQLGRGRQRGQRPVAALQLYYIHETPLISDCVQCDSVSVTRDLRLKQGFYSAEGTAWLSCHQDSTHSTGSAQALENLTQQTHLLMISRQDLFLLILQYFHLTPSVLSLYRYFRFERLVASREHSYSDL